MNNLIRIIVLQYFLLLILNSPVNAGDFIQEREWLLKPVNARGAAMGNANASLVDDANTVFCNPGGVSLLDGINTSCSYNPDPSNPTKIKYNILSISSSLSFMGKYIVGLNYRKFHQYDVFSEGGDESPPTMHNRWNKDIGVFLGLKIKNVGIGINSRFLNSEYFSVEHQLSFAFDAGAIYSKDIIIKDIYPLKFNIGISLLNISKGMKYRSSSYGEFKRASLPKIFKAGYSILFKPYKNNKKLTILTITHSLEYSDILNVDDQIGSNKSLGLGVEFLLYESVFLRIGNNFTNSNGIMSDGFTYGAGVNIPIYRIFENIPLIFKYDYAQFPYVKDLSRYSHYNKLHSFNVNYIF